MIEAGKQAVTYSPQWNWTHTFISGGSAIAIWRYLKLEIPNVFNWLQAYCSANDGGLIEIVFHKIFGKPKDTPKP